MENCDKSFNDQIDFLIKEHREKKITIGQLMQLIQMAYGDYLEFHPDKLPESRFNGKKHTK